MPSQSGTINIDIPVLNQWKTTLGWSNRILATRSGVSERTIERIYATGSTSRYTYSQVLNAIREAVVESGQALGLPVGSIEIPSSLQLDQERVDKHPEFGDGAVIVGIAVGAKELEITIDGDLESFTPEKRDEVLRHIQHVLESDRPPSAIRFRRGSIKMTIRVSPEESERLKWAIRGGQMVAVGITDVEPPKVDVGSPVVAAPVVAAPVVAAPANSIDTHQMTVSESIDAHELRHLLKRLSEEDCFHTWRNFHVNGSLEELLQWENTLRPTKIFFYFSEQDGKTHLVGAAAVADKLKQDFPYNGFCVLSRCYILPEFRSRGFYRRILRHRLEHCRDHYSSELNAIHIGSVDPRVARVITNHRLSGWPTFTHLGEEELHIAGESRMVGAYLLFMPEYLGRIRRLLAGDGAPRGVTELRMTLADESGATRGLSMLVKNAFNEALAEGWFDYQDPLEIKQLLRFSRSIPLVGFGEL